MFLRYRIVLSLALLAGALAGGARAQEAPAPALERGLASWYGPEFGGQVAASGETFDPRQMTAAHRTLPFGTKVLVRRTDSEASVVVRINDRGPFIDSRIIDLSYAAARQLGATDPGLVPVVLEILEMADDAPAVVATAIGAPLRTPQQFAVQAGTFRNPDNASRTRDRIRARFANVEVQHEGEFFRVLVNAASEAEAQSMAAEIRQMDAAYQSAFIVPR